MLKPFEMGSVRGREIQREIDAVYRSDGPRVLATLIRLLGDFELAEDAMQAAFTAAIERWPKDGVPTNPRAWLISTGRFKAIDAIRRETRLFASLRELASKADVDLFPMPDASAIEDDRLRLIFTCCHPAVSQEGQVALTLREVCGLTTEEIAHAFLTPLATIAQRIVRAKAKIRTDKIPFEIPPQTELPDRTQSVLQVVYLLFNEGYYASSGESLTRQVLSDEAIRLARLICELMPEPEVFGVLSLMLLQASRRAARTSSIGDIILLADQNTSLWDHALIAEGLEACARACSSSNPGIYALQASIAATHVNGVLQGQTDWDRIVCLYDQMLSVHPSAVVELNRAVAVSMRDGLEAGLDIVDNLLEGDELKHYALAYAIRGDFCRRLQRFKDAQEAYERAIELTEQAAERRFLESRLREVSDLNGDDRSDSCSNA